MCKNKIKKNELIQGNVKLSKTQTKKYVQTVVEQT